VSTATAASTYNWSTAANTSSIVVSPSVTTLYTIIGTDVNGCVSSAVNTVTVNALPNLTLSGNSSFCSGSSLTQTVSGANTYTWNTGENTATISITPTISTTYSVNGTDINNCVGIVSQSITVNALPTLSVSSTSSLLCTGKTATLSANGASTYTWSSSEINSTIVVTPSANITYTVHGTDNNGCINSTVISQSVSPCTGIEEQTLDELFLIYPNPHSGQFMIETEKEVQIIVTNMLSEIVLAQKLYKGKNEVSIHNQSEGIYFIKCENTTFKIIKQ